MLVSCPTVIRLSGFVLLLLSITQPVEGRVRWETPGSYRLHFVELRPYQIDSEGKLTNEQALLRHRLRLQPTVEVGAVTAHIELDVLTGQIFGTTTSIGADFAQRRELDPDDAYDGWTTVEPRQAWFDVTLPWVYLKLGQFNDHWGLGLRQHGGEEQSHNSGWIIRPSVHWLGDLVARGQISLRPPGVISPNETNDLELKIGAGIVYQDEEGTLFDEDQAVEYLIGLEYPGDSVQTGLQYLRREQRGRGEGELLTNTIDAYLRFQQPLFLLNAQIKAELEYAAIFGQRSQPTTFGEVVPKDLQGWGAVGRLAYRLNCPRVVFGADFGYLSGDHADTETDESFTADPDFKLGFILIPDVLRSQSVRSAEKLRLKEQERSEFLGANELPTRGAGRNVAYFAPAVSWRPGAFLLGLYSLTAWSVEPVFDPLNTLNAGGTPTTPLGDAASSYYGTELSLMAKYHLGWTRYRGAMMGITAGVLLPGSAIVEGEVGDPISKIVWSLDLGW